MRNLRMLKRRYPLLSVKHTNYARWFKVSSELIKHTSFDVLQKLLDYQMGYVINTKGRFVTNITLKISDDGQDFIRNLQTCVIEYKIFKKPRFIKRSFIPSKP